MEKNSTKNLILTLSIIGIISALLLTFVYQWTSPYIQANQAENQRKAINEVLSGAETIKQVEKDGETFYEGYSADGQRIGVAYKSSGGGYNGIIELMIGFDIENQKIFRISVLSHEETPGLGARITEQEFKSNFVNKPFGQYQVVKTPAQSELDVEAISGATISSVRTTRIIQDAVTKITKAYGGGK